MDFMTFLSAIALIWLNLWMRERERSSQDLAGCSAKLPWKCTKSVTDVTSCNTKS